MESKFETHFEKVVGGNEEDKDKARSTLQGWFEDKNTIPSRFELEKTERDNSIITAVEAEVDDMVAAYGGTSKPLPPERIYVVHPGSMGPVTGGKFERGFHSELGQYVAVEREESDLQFALILAHELLHLKSLKMAGVVDHPGAKTDTVDIRLYRSGLTMVERNGEKKRGTEVMYFAALEEAIVAEVTDRLYRSRMKSSFLFADEVQGIDEINPWLQKALESRKLTSEEKRKQQDAIAELRTLPPRSLMEILQVLRDSKLDEAYKTSYLWDQFQALTQQQQIGFRERLEERKKFDELLERIWQQSRGKFRDKEDLFREFANANFTGRYLRIARIIEDALGKGSFRRVAKEFALSPDLAAPSD